jgi:26S proteasome regulatory subunit T3
LNLKYDLPVFKFVLSKFNLCRYTQEAGLQAVRKNRYVIMPKDFEKGYKSSVRKPGDDFEFYK